MTQPYDPDIQRPRPGSIPPPEAYLPPAPAAAAEGAHGHAGAGAAAGAGAVVAGTYLDQASGLALPQGVQLASAGRRIGAYFLAFPLAVVTLGIGYFIWGLVVWGSGQTPALQVLGMRCWKPETRHVASWGTMAFREIIGRLVDGILGITLLVSFILMLTRQDRRCLHDLVAGTVVVRDPDKILTGSR